jgi:hypothetical protein
MPRILSLHEITDILEADDSIEASAIVIQTPENATAPVSDEDSGDEEGGTIKKIAGFFVARTCISYSRWLCC